jgi:uncharacterized membrane protein YfcA
MDPRVKPGGDENNHPRSFRADLSLFSNPVFLIAALVSVTTLGISKGGFIGLGVIAVPLLSLVVTPPQAAAILLPILLAQDALSVAAYRRDFSPWNLKVLIPGAAFGTVLSTFTAASLSADVVRIAVALIAIFFVLSRVAAAWVEHHLPKPSVATGLFWGTVAGFASAIANAGSPPYQIHMLPQRLPKMTFVGTTALYFAATNLMKIPSYFVLGQLTWENLSVGIALIPLALATNFLGLWLVRRVPMEAFYRIAYVLIFLIACELLRSGVMDLMRG